MTCLSLILRVSRCALWLNEGANIFVSAMWPECSDLSTTLAQRKCANWSLTRADEELQKIADAMKSTYLSQYLVAMAGCPSFPEDIRQANNILNLCLMEKAFYEIEYEMSNRPDWIDIPIVGLLSILDGRETASFVLSDVDPIDRPPRVW